MYLDHKGNRKGDIIRVETNQTRESTSALSTDLKDNWRFCVHSFGVGLFWLQKDAQTRILLSHKGLPEFRVCSSQKNERFKVL